MPAQMMAITRTEYGGPEVLSQTAARTPTPGDEELLVRVAAASPNAADRWLLAGVPWMLRLQSGLRRPRQPWVGADVAGVVERVGRDVQGFDVGDPVFGTTAQRGFAELTLLAASHAALVPDGVTMAQAAALPIAGTTALTAIERGRVAQGDRVVVNGASGGVGHYAVQLAHHRGAEVTAVCSPHGHDLVRQLGATHVVDRLTQDYTTTDKPWDVILDVQGTHTAAANHRALVAGGRWVVIGGPMDNRLLGPMAYLAKAQLRFLLGSREAHMFVADQRKDLLEALAALTARGALVPAIERTWPLAEAADAMQHVVAGRTQGKVVLEVASLEP